MLVSSDFASEFHVAKIRGRSIRTWAGRLKSRALVWPLDLSRLKVLSFNCMEVSACLA